MELRPIRVVSYGLGAIGKQIAHLIAETPGLELVGGIDEDARLVGRRLNDVLGLAQLEAPPVGDDPSEVLTATRPDVVVLATTSFLRSAYPQLVACLRARVNVVSTCEELVYPYASHPELAARLHELARLSGVTVLGAGVNPGFIMDLLPLTLTAPCSSVRRISVTRVIDATARRASLQERIGAGLTLDQFREHTASGHVRHVGLRESVHMIADAVGWQIERIHERSEPILAQDWVRCAHLTVAPGQIAGLHQTAIGIVEGRETIVLDWRTAVGAPETYDSIIIDGVPPIDLRFKGGLHGDQAAAALVLHAIRPVFLATPGLQLVTDIPPLHFTVPASASARRS